jgi:hypothetical protein
MPPLCAALVIAKLDRSSRDAHFPLGLENAGVNFVAADMPKAKRASGERSGTPNYLPSDRPLRDFSHAIAHGFFSTTPSCASGM